MERGWAVLIPMRRGRGGSGGEYLERYDCDRAILTAGVERAVEDLDAVLAFVAAQPWADPARLLLGGMSRGGLLAVVYPSRRAVAARGVVSFAGGWTVERCDGRTRFNEDTFTEAGRTARLPMLWLYSENDRNYGPASVRAYHPGLRPGGWDRGARDVPAHRPRRAHPAAGRSPRAWGTAVSEFLTRLGLGEP